MSKRVKLILIASVIIVALVVVFSAIAENNDDGIKVAVEEVKKQTVVETVSASGKLYPEVELKISSANYGEVTDVLVQEGDTVKKGQILAKIYGPQAEGNASMRVQSKNISDLLQNLQQSNSTTAKASVNNNIKAPMDGIITAMNIRKGERIGMQTSGAEIMRIADMSALEIRVEVNENDIIKVSIGDSADVVIDAYNKRKFKGAVTQITNAQSKNNASSFITSDITAYEVHIRLNADSYQDLLSSAKPKSFPLRSSTKNEYFRDHK